MVSNKLCWSSLWTEKFKVSIDWISNYESLFIIWSFLDEITGSYEQYATNNPINISESEYGTTALKLFAKFNWSTKNIEYLLPVYHFYNVARHCIVHQMGKANKELIKLSVSDDFLNAIKKLANSNTRRSTISAYN